MSTEPEETEVFAKQGDIILQLGERRFLVLSVALSLASPVFAAMLDGRFSEGQALSAISPRIIPLPDDHAASMALVCNIIHLRAAEVKTTIDVEALVKVAILADKYDCVDALRPWSMVWVAALAGRDDPYLEKLLFAAYVLDLPDEFFKISQSMIRDTSKPLSIIAALNEHNFLPIRVLDRILEEIREVHDQALTILYDTVLDAEVCCADDGRTFAGQVFMLMHNVGVLSSRLISISTIKTEISRIGLDEHMLPCDGDCICVMAAIELAKSGITEIYNGVKGLCLDCVKREGSKDCRIVHGESGSLKY